MGSLINFRVSEAHISKVDEATKSSFSIFSSEQSEEEHVLSQFIAFVAASIVTGSAKYNILCASS